MKNALEGLQDVELSIGEELFDLDFTGDPVRFCKTCTVHTRQTREGCNSIHYVLCIFKVWSAVKRLKDSSADYDIPRRKLATVYGFTYFGDFLITDGGTMETLNTYISNLRVAYVGLKHLW